MPSDPASFAARLREFRRGMGEVLAFFGAGLTAFLEFCLGRWPGARRRKKMVAATSLSEKVEPYPVND